MDIRLGRQSDTEGVKDEQTAGLREMMTGRLGWIKLRTTFAGSLVSASVLSAAVAAASVWGSLTCVTERLPWQSANTPSLACHNIGIIVKRDSKSNVFLQKKCQFVLKSMCVIFPTKLLLVITDE